MNQMQKSGKIALVGAGPGDPDLITVRGKKLIENCDALVYDYLVAPEMLAWTRPTCEHICVGKRQGFHSVSQEQIQEILLTLAQQGKTVVRLKGGDPFIFGRGGEEIRFLDNAGIEWEVVPGITAALGAAARIGMPLTDRNFSSGVLFLTGHDDPNKPESPVEWERYGSLGLTLCLYMSMKRLPDICRSLIRGGASTDTPVRVIEWATTPQERTCLGTLNDICPKITANGIGAPAIVIIGIIADKATRVSP